MLNVNTLLETDDQRKQEKVSYLTINISLLFASFAMCDSDFLMYISCFNLILSEFQINFILPQSSEPGIYCSISQKIELCIKFVGKNIQKDERIFICRTDEGNGFLDKRKLKTV